MTAPLPPRPRTVVAVHGNHVSATTAARPAHPSYFLKPAGSVAGSGGSVERPPGTDLLTCEGEVAVVIGSTARRVRREDAWAHVGWVTAANDLGLPDLRAADRGSNLRSKGGDGFTPLGPAFIDARAVDPAGLRVRTWVNGELVQEGTTAGLVFGIEELVADLSQHLTLEPGDVVLTGTPAGSAAVVPGDRVEVEVDAPTAAGAPSSGRLVTTVVQGDAPLDPALRAVPAPAAPTAELPAELRDKLRRAPTAGLSAQLRKRGLDDVTIEGVRSLVPGQKVVGLARTLRYVPHRADLFAAHGGGYNAQKRTFDAVREGEVLVIEARGETAAATLGDVLAIRAAVRGAAGIVTDGGVRDVEAVAAVGIPVYAAGAHPAVLGRRHVPWDADLTIACGGTTVQPGDVVVGDADGVLVIPPALVEEVVDAALAQEEEDAWVAEQARAGHPLDGLFPMDAGWRARYEARGRA